MDSGTAYRIVVRGELDDRFAYLFNGVEMQRVDGNTVLTGILDQAQLHGFIERLEELALELVTVEQIGGLHELRTGSPGHERRES